MKKNLFFLIAIVISSSFSYSQDWTWGNSILGTGGNVEVTTSITDKEGNTFVCGIFLNEIFNENTQTTTPSMGLKDIFIAKYSNSGSLTWIRYGQGSYDNLPKDISLDQDNNVYIIGDTKGDCIFSSVNNTETVLNATPAGNRWDAFLVKYSTDGDLFWAKNISSGSHHNRAGTLLIDTLQNNIIFTGNFRSENIFSTTETINSIGNSGAYIGKLDTAGTYISNYHIELPIAGSSANIFDIKLYNNQLYFLGVFAGTMNLESSQLLTDGGNTDIDAFLYKTDLNFNTEVWSNRIHSSSYDYSYEMVVNEFGIFTGGYSNGNNIVFESSSTADISESLTGTSYDIFTLKYNVDGNLVNQNTYKGLGEFNIYGMSYTNNSIMYIGNFNNELIIGSDTLNSSNNTKSDVFWFKTDINNLPVFADHTKGNSDDIGRTVSVDLAGDIIISGSYKSDPFILASAYGNEDSLNVASPGFSDGFIAKYTPCGYYDIRLFIDSTSCVTSNDGKASLIVFKDEAIDADTIKYNWDYLWSTTETTDTIENLSNGWAFVTLSNRYGCTYTDSVLVSHEALLTTQLTDEVTLNCATDLYPTDTVFGFLGQRPYEYAWSSGLGTDSVITDVPVGTHTVTVTDACGTSVIDTIVVGHIPTLISTISTHNTIIACIDGDDGEAWMNTSQGFGTIEYEWENSASTDYIASDLSVGLHHVTVTDGCVSIEESVNVVNLPSMNSNISSSTPTSCVGNMDGKAETFVVGGVQPYTYVWSTGETTANAINLPEGLAYVTVSDACGSIISSVDITVEPDMEIELSATHELCSGANGTVTVNAINGSGTYTYVWDTVFPISSTPISTNQTVSDLSADRYYVEVSDACGTKTDFIDVTTNTPLVAVLSAQTQILNCETSTNGSVSVIANHGVLPYNYTWSTSASTGASANDLGVGIEYVTVTDQCGTEIINSVNVVNLPAMNANISSSTPVSCEGISDGMAETFVVGGVQPYSYIWSSGETTANASNLPESLVFVTITDVCGSVVESVNISVETSMNIQLTAQHESCSGGDGSVTVNASNGSGNYTYAWDIIYPISSTPISNNNTVTNLSADRYYVEVTDDCGTKVDSINLTTNAILVASLSSHSEILNCDTSTNGSVSVIASNGVLPYEYAWSSSSSTNAIATDLHVGTEYVTITDQCGTEIIDSVIVGYYPQLIAFAEFMDDANCITTNDGKASVIATGGVQPYSFIWSNSTSTGTIADDLPSGMQYVTVSDYCGLTLDSVIITVEPGLELELSANNETCSANNGSVFVSPSNGSGAYSFAWDITYPISANPISTNDTVNNLSADRYYVEVSDECGTKIDSIDLTSNTILQATLSSHSEILSCDTSSNGSVSVIANHGVLPYNYTWSTSTSTSATRNDLVTGTEYVTITDQCGTEIIDSIIVGYYPKLIAFAEFMHNANCINTNDGKASVVATGGVQPYSFNWSNSASTINIADDLPLGLQYVTVSDYCGLAIDSVEIGSIPTLTVELSSSALQCPGDSLGSITASANFGILPYTYNWGSSSNDNSSMIDSLWAGMHYVTVTDLCNAPIIDSIEIETTPILNAYLTNHFVTVTCPSSSNGINEIVVNGGLAPYNYTWTSGATTKIVDNLNVGMHYATITDQCARSIVDSVNVSHLPAMDISTIANDPLCHNDTNGTIEIEVSQGIYPISLVWEDFTNSNYTQTDLVGGTYTFTITDQCASIVDSISLDNPEIISIAGNITDETSSTSMDGAIQTVVNGGTSPYQFLWNNNEVSQDLVDIPAGIYILAVTDYNDCSTSQTFEVETKVIRIEPMEAFTPNSDGVNDVWDITNISEFPNADIKIFNQWGNLVYETKGYDEPWDGTNKGSELSAAVYYYIIDLKDGLEAQTGSITLIR